VRLESLHLTLRFLGPTAEERLPAVRRALETAAAAHAPFRVGIRGGGAFPSLDRPRAIWLGVADPDGGLVDLAAALGRTLAEAGWEPDDRSFTPHLTVARTDGVRSGPRLAADLVAEARGLDAWFEVERVVLYESRPRLGPASYTALSEAPLSGVPLKQ
jgi:2'-5' RNA ligase